MARTIALHHSRFSRQGRPLLNTEVESRICKTRWSGALILVDTQSLDLDADLLITDLCSMDVQPQRTGRLHRHDLSPKLIKSEQRLGRFDKGSGVYPDLRAVGKTAAWPRRRPTASRCKRFPRISAKHGQDWSRRLPATPGPERVIANQDVLEIDKPFHEATGLSDGHRHRHPHCRTRPAAAHGPCTDGSLRCAPASATHASRPYTQ